MTKKIEPITFIDLFAGIGGIRLGFESAGCKCVFTSEWDKYSQQTYKANFDVEPHGDITKIREQDIPPFDILTAGFPCQPFSSAGLGKGELDIRGTLFYDVIRICEAKKPTHVLLENVKGLTTKRHKETFEKIRVGGKFSLSILKEGWFSLNTNNPFCISTKKLCSFT